METNNDVDASKNRTKTITFRLSASIIDDLKQDAEIEKINLNGLVSRILSNHILWERYERKVGLLPMTKPFVKDAINRLDEKEIINLAQKIEKDTSNDIFNSMKVACSIEDFIEILRTWLNVAWMQHFFKKSKGFYHFKIQHDIGKNWSLYIKTLVTGLFEDIIGKKLQVQTSKNSITFIFPAE
ncbi:MAG: hypothetical protein ACREAK_04070 [Nitrosarchaeum sp.]